MVALGKQRGSNGFPQPWELTALPLLTALTLCLNQKKG